MANYNAALVLASLLLLHLLLTANCQSGPFGRRGSASLRYLHQQQQERMRLNGQQRLARGYEPSRNIQGLQDMEFMPARGYGKRAPPMDNVDNDVRNRNRNFLLEWIALRDLTGNNNRNRGLQIPREELPE